MPKLEFLILPSFEGGELRIRLDRITSYRYCSELSYPVTKLWVDHSDAWEIPGDITKQLDALLKPRRPKDCL
jgi:hypothetical protein